MEEGGGVGVVAGEMMDLGGAGGEGETSEGTNSGIWTGGTDGVGTSG